MRNVQLCVIVTVALIIGASCQADEPVTYTTDEIVSSGDHSDELSSPDLDEYNNYWQQMIGMGIIDNEEELVTVAPIEPSIVTTKPPVTPIELAITTTEPSGMGIINDNEEELTITPTEWLQAMPVEPSSAVIPIDQSTCPLCSCGAAGKIKRVVGGSPTYKHQYPWMALITYRGKYSCGASLINNKYVLTVAHCVHMLELDGMSVRLLEHDRYDDKESKHINLKVKRVITHHKYVPFTHEYDISLVRMDTEGINLGQDTGIHPVCLPDAGKTYAGYEGIVIGWGATKHGGFPSRVLHEVSVQIMSNKDCTKTHYEERIKDSMMCAGYPEGEKDACQGDSGSPMHINVDSVYHVVGLVSWGKGCARPNYPGVYARVNSFLKWVAKNTRDACLCSVHRLPRFCFLMTT